MVSRSGLRSAKCDGSPRLTAAWASLFSARVPTCGCNPAVAVTPAAFSWHFVPKQQMECRHQNPRRPPTPHVHHTPIMMPFCHATKTTLPLCARCVQNRLDSFRYLSVSTSNSWSNLLVSPPMVEPSRCVGTTLEVCPGNHEGLDFRAASISPRTVLC